MSVLKSQRTHSKAEFIKVAHEILSLTINFLLKLSARYSRLLSNKISDLAMDVLINIENGNAIYPSSEDRINMRHEYFLKAEASLKSLDAACTICYDILMKNPQGAFATPGGKEVEPSKAAEKLDKLATELGESIRKEIRMLNTR